jgi:hypothetical protein
MFPPNHVRQEPLLASVEPVPLMYPLPCRNEYAPDAELAWLWQLEQFPAVPPAR